MIIVMITNLLVNIKLINSTTKQFNLCVYGEYTHIAQNISLMHLYMLLPLWVEYYSLTVDHKLRPLGITS
jgi:hypothetical protein